MERPAVRDVSQSFDVAIFGAGPAGLMAAQTASELGVQVVVFEAGPSPGRKFLVAGRGGLNLSNAAPREEFLAQYSGATPEFWARLFTGFDREALQRWCRDLGSETFTGTSGRIFPVEKRSARLLIAWIRGLKSRGVAFCFSHKWLGFAPGGHRVSDGSDSIRIVKPASTILAFGGASWPQTGSDAGWVQPIRQEGVKVNAFEASNCGWEIAWPDDLIGRIEGLPLKNVVVCAGALRVAGECLITRYGIEGGAIYRLGPDLRRMSEPAITIDLKPTLSIEAIAVKLGNDSARRGPGKALRLSPAASALVEEFVGTDSDAMRLAAGIKNLRVPLVRPRPIAEAISSAGGVGWDEVTRELMLRRVPGTYVAGEMLDWDAPTGGYLLHACLAMGRVAGAAAAANANANRSRSV
jgi:uncharacterized flavoprotein (TIGR03862 family)